MSAFTVIGTSRLGVEPTCGVCRAGATTSFNWGYAKQQPEQKSLIAAFRHWQDLRRGSLYRCEACNECWHLNDDQREMTHVAADRLSLVLAWNQQAITLSHEMVSTLETIGETPPDRYGNGSRQRLTPCCVTTKGGEKVELAMICVQKDAPVQDYWTFRLGSEIHAVAPSPHALPLAVRLATSRAHEMRMGFCPTLIEMPDHRRFVLNGTPNFFMETGYAAVDSRVVEGSYFEQDPPPPFAQAPNGIIYFIVDGDPATERAIGALRASAPPPIPWHKRVFRRR
ncbi:MAG: hypothetical protein ACM3W4_11135 [Ignavibacteriales bacterium]